jgi:hypothetical protein
MTQWLLIVFAVILGVWFWRTVLGPYLRKRWGK